MFKNIGKFKITMHDLALHQSLESMQNLNKILQSLLLRKLLPGFDGGEKIALIAKLEDEVDVIDSFLDVDQPDDIVIFAALQDLNLVLEQLGELPWVFRWLPLILSRRMVLTATSTPSTFEYPRNTSPNCPLPIFDSST